MSNRIIFNPTEDLNLGDAFSDDKPVDRQVPSAPSLTETLQEDAESRPGPTGRAPAPAPVKTRPKKRKPTDRVEEVVTAASTRLHLQLVERIADALRDHARDTHASQPDVLSTAYVHQIAAVREQFSEYVAEDKEREREGLPPKKRSIDREPGRRKVSMRVSSSLTDLLKTEATKLRISLSELVMCLLERELDLAANV